MIELSVVILSWNTKDLLKACLNSIYSKTYDFELEVLVVDNASKDDSCHMVQKDFPEAILIRNDKNEGYAGGNNIGIRASKGQYVLMLNSDTEVKDQAFERMMDFLKNNPDYGGCGGQLFNPDNTVQRACMRFPTLFTPLFYDTFVEKWWPNNRIASRYFMKDFDHTRSMDVDQPPGACFMVTREVIEKVGVLDETLWLFFNDVDYCKRIRDAGYRIRFLEGARVLHHIGGSTRKYGDFSLLLHSNRVLYYRKYYGLWGVLLTKFVAIIKGFEEIMRCLRAGCKMSSPEVKHIKEVVKKVLKT